MDTMARSDVRHEMLRIAGRKVETAARHRGALPLGQPRWSARVPRATPEHGGRGVQDRRTPTSPS